MNSDLQNKLSHFEAEPPEGVWNKIADALDEESTFSQRLFAYEEQPPLQVWNDIETALDETVPTKVIPFTTRFKTPLRYIAAASVIAVILVITTLSINKTGAGSLQAGNAPVHAVDEQQPEASNKKTQADNEDSQVSVQSNQDKQEEYAVVTKRKTASIIKPQTI